MSERKIKCFINDDYEIFFDPQSGFEMMRGANGKPDPFSLQLPSLLDIGVMGTCVNKCAFCYQGHQNNPNMKLEDFKSIVDQVKHHTNQVALGGRGDPNKHENFKEIIEYARENNVMPNYTTSGIDLTDDEIEISKMCGAVAVSDYHTPTTYEAIERFMDAGIKTNIHMIFSQGSFGDAIKILYGRNPWEVQGYSTGRNTLVDINRLNAVIFLLFKPAGAGENLIGMRPTEYQFGVFSSLIFNSKAKFKVGMDSCLCNHVLKKSTPTELQQLSIDTCEGARMSAYITPDMKLMPCSFANKGEWAISIGKKDIKEIWNNSKPFKKFRRMLRKQKDKCPLEL
jgi:hypothetical protein